MASITIRNLDNEVKRKLRIRAAANGRSMEEEVRQILKAALVQPQPSNDWARELNTRFAAAGGLDRDLR